MSSFSNLLLQRFVKSSRAKSLIIHKDIDEITMVQSLESELDNEREMNKVLLSQITDLIDQLKAERQKSLEEVMKNQGNILLLASSTDSFPTFCHTIPCYCRVTPLSPGCRVLHASPKVNRGPVTHGG
jgi:hypothetical protein